MQLPSSRALMLLVLALCAAENHALANSLLFQADVPPPPGTTMAVDEVPTPATDSIASVMDDSIYGDASSKGAKTSLLADCCGCVCLEVGGIYLHRANPDNQVLMTNPTAGDAVVLQTDDANLDWAGGLQFTLTAQWDACRDVQLSYFSISEWEGAAAVADTGVDYETPFTGVGTFFRSGQFTLHSELQNFEVNMLNHNCSWTWLYGFRHINLSENGMFQLGTPDALVTVDVENHLWGLQVGGQGRVMDGCRLSVDVWGKAGVYYNDNQQNCITSGAFGNTAVTHGNDGVAFVGDAGIRAEYCLNQCSALYLGYQMLWLGMDNDGLALATKQFDKIGGPPATDVTGDAFYHGLTFGIEICH